MSSGVTKKVLHVGQRTKKSKNSTEGFRIVMKRSPEQEEPSYRGSEKPYTLTIL